MLSEQETVQETEPAQPTEQKPAAKPKATTKSGKPNLRGTSELTIHYVVGELRIGVKARTHTLSARDVEEEVKRRIVWRDLEGNAVRYTDTPFRRGYFRVDSETGKVYLEKVEDVDKTLEMARQLTKASPGDQWPLVLVARDGEFLIPIEAQSAKPYLIQDDGTEVPVDMLEKTKEIRVTEEDLRPSVTYDQWLVERVKEIFAVERGDRYGQWLIVQDLIKRDAVIAVQQFVERKGLTEYRLILKPFHDVQNGKFELLGAVVRKPLELEWGMDVPVGQEAEAAKKAEQGKTVSLLGIAGQKKL